MIMWGQKLMNKEYLVDKKLIGKDMKETGAPSVYGYDTIEKILNFN